MPGDSGPGHPVPADRLPALPDDFAELVGELSEETSPSRRRRLLEDRMTGLAGARWPGQLGRAAVGQPGRLRQASSSAAGG